MGPWLEGEFATEKKFHDYAKRVAQGYLWEGTLTFAKRQRCGERDQLGPATLPPSQVAGLI
jgi:hypothetical protein